MRAAHNLLILALATAGCSIDKFLEGEQPSDARLRVALQTTSLTIIQGQEQALSATVSIIGTFNGAIAVTVESVPFGVTAEVGPPSSSGGTITHNIVIRVGPTALPGTYAMAVRAHANQIPVDDVEYLTLTVQAPAAFALSVSQPSFTIARGGIAPGTITISRTNYGTPVALSLTGAPGITAGFAGNPTAGTSATMTLSVTMATAAGSYEMTLHGLGDGLAERTVKFTVLVTNDPIQVISASGIAARQGSIASTDLIVNRGGYAGPVALSVDNLPAGVTAAFDPAEPTGTAALLRLTIQPSATAGSYTLLVRGTAPGIPDALSEVNLVIHPSGIVLALTPPTLSLFAGQGSGVTLSIGRVNLSDPVTMSLEGVPAGISMALNPAVVTGSSSSIQVSVAGATAPGTYPVTIRAVPEGWPPGASVTVPMNVTVRELPPGGGNVVLDWGGCTPPDWVGVQNGTGAWVRALPVNGVVAFTVNAGRGGYAWVESGNTVQVRYQLQGALTAGPIPMCPGAAPAGKTITGTAVHNAASETFNHMMGGAQAISTFGTPNFTLTGVREGLHDFLAWGTTATPAGTRGYIRRDVDLPNGGSLGSIDLLGPSGFTPQRHAITIVNGSTDLLSHGMTYLTSASCTPAPLYAGVIGSGNLMSGVPAVLQRDNDFHLVTTTAISGGRTRVHTLAFHSMNVKTVTLPAIMTAAISVTPQPGPFKILRAFISGIPPEYNGSYTLRYSGGIRSVTIVASVAYTGTVGPTLQLPDFSAIDGFPVGAVVGSGEFGTWNVSLDGSSLPSASPCTENRTTVFFNQQGGF